MSHRALFTLTLFLTVANLLVWSFLGVEKAYANRVYPGVWVEAQPLAGLTREQAIDRLKPVNEAMVAQKVTLLLADQDYHPTLAQLGYKVDTAAMADAAIALGRGPDWSRIVHSVLDYQKTKSIPIVYDIDQGTFDNYLNDISKEIVKEPKNLALDYKNGNFIITPAEAGVTLDKEAIREAIQRQAKPGQPATIKLEVNKTAPVITDQSQLLDAKDQLIRLLAKPVAYTAADINGQLLPDELYSLIYFEVKDNKLAVNFDENKVHKAVVGIAKKVDIPPTNEQLSEATKEILLAGQDGRQLDVPDAVRQLTARLNTASSDLPIIFKVDAVSHKTVTISPEYTLGLFPGRYIVIDLSAQRMHLIEGSNYHKTFIVSTGKWDKPTPIGTFSIQNHFLNAFSKKYGLYMPFWMAISEDGGYGIHQLPYWPNGRVEGTSHLGTPVSHGCIRLGPGEAEYVYNWAAEGTPVVIHQ